MSLSPNPIPYVELPLGSLDPHRVEAIWRWDARSLPAGEQLILPDGRIDLLVHCTLHGARVVQAFPVVCGPADRPAPSAVRAGSVSLGVRFHIGWGGLCLGVSPIALRNRLLHGRALEESLGAMIEPLRHATTLREVESALRRVCRAQCRGALPSEPQQRALHAIERLKREVGRGGRVRVALDDAADRTLRRHVLTLAGFPLRTLGGVLRFRRAVELLEGAAPGVSLSEIALAAGYADQAHMTRRFRRFGGFTPKRPEPAPRVGLAG